MEGNVILNTAPDYTLLMNFWKSTLADRLLVLKRSVSWENVERHADLLRYTVYNYETRHRIYTIMMEQSPEGIHLLELYTPDAPRFTIPWLWLKVKQTHNLDIIPEKDFEKFYS